MNCSFSLQEDAIEPEDGGDPIVPLIPLMPSKPISVRTHNAQCSSLRVYTFRHLTLQSHCTSQDMKGTLDPTVTEAHTGAPDGLEADPSATVPSPGQIEGSSEEDLDSLCDGEMSSQQIKRTIGNGIMKLGLWFLENLKPSREQPNLIISPLSLSVALSQLALGKSGIYNKNKRLRE